MTSFAALSLPPALARAIEVLGFAQLTPVQAHALPPALAGQDVIAQARTGSGKTVAFGLALLARVDVGAPRVQGLVLCPTRELADQVGEELRRLARFVANLRVVTLAGGVPVRTQKPSLEQPPHVVVGTPGRILDHLARGHLSFDGLRVLVLDEADRMLDMGFHDAIMDVVATTPAARQTLLFSATFPDEVRALAAGLLRTPADVRVDVEVAVDVDEVFHSIEPDRRLEALVAVLAQAQAAQALVFCQTRNDVRDLSEALARRGFVALALHGELEQRERDDVLVRFANRSASVLVATDVAARGLDIKGLPLVVSYELPVDPDVHVHRIGRTARAGEKGRAVALVAPRERGRAAAIAAAREGAGLSIVWQPLPAGAAVTPPAPAMVTLVIEGGRQDKLRKGDLLGALTGEVGLPGEAVGRIDVLANRTYVAIRRDEAARALDGLRRGRIKGKTWRVWRR